MGLEKWMTVEPDGTRTPEIDIYIVTKDGTVRENFSVFENNFFEGKNSEMYTSLPHHL